MDARAFISIEKNPKNNIRNTRMCTIVYAEIAENAIGAVNNIIFYYRYAYPQEMH